MCLEFRLTVWHFSKGSYCLLELIQLGLKTSRCAGMTYVVQRVLNIKSNLYLVSHNSGQKFLQLTLKVPWTLRMMGCEWRRASAETFALSVWWFTASFQFLSVLPFVHTDSVWQLSVTALSHCAEFSSTPTSTRVQQWRTEFSKPLTIIPVERLENCRFIEVPFLNLGSLGIKGIVFSFFCWQIYTPSIYCTASGSQDVFFYFPLFPSLVFPGVAAVSHL